MKVLITGGAGFIGSYLTDILYQAGYEIIIIDNLIPQIHGLNKEDSYLYRQVKNKATIIEEDICDSQSLDELVSTADYIVHLAAETGTGQSMYDLSNYIRTNTYGTSLVLEKLVKNKHHVKKFILASSRAVYGEGRYLCSKHGFVFPGARNPEDMKKGDFECKCPECNATLELVPTDENSKVDPRSIYGMTKLNQEQLTALTCANIQLPYTIFRFQNVYGKGQSLANPYTGILAIFSGLILQNKEINIFEDGLESRDFIHVKDIAMAIKTDMESPVNNQLYNLGSGKSTSVLDIVNLLKNNFENELTYSISGSFRIGDIRHNLADISLAQKHLGFSQTVTLEDGIAELTEWIKDQERSSFKSYENSINEMKKHNLYYSKEGK